ncbi:MAG: glycosyltransferase family 9 protein [Candidatus Omnitrophica bacterium]|nr:glycosyltransferase family 9 protein [Candidatus Omnitrophota bacterium]MBU4478590.1 glycosyltransferase family 9 protein [Candidatus Omnitrophota bacterium]
MDFAFLHTKPFKKFKSQKPYLELKDKVKEIAIYKGGGGLGDLAVGVPFFKMIREAFPDSKIYYMGIIYPRFEKIFKAIPYFDGYIHFERPDKGKGIRKFLRFRKEWKGKIDLLIDTQRRWETSFWLRCLNPKYMLSASAFLSDWPMPGLHYKKMHILEQLISLPARLGIQDFDLTGTKLSLPQESQCKAEKFLSGFSQSKFIAMFPGCGMDFKNWLPEYFAKLGDLFAEKGYNVLLLGSPKNIELLRAVSQKMRYPSILPLEINKNLTTEILDEAAILEYCKAVIGNDSGSLHLASCLGILSAAIFGPTTPRKFSPIGPRSIIFYKNLPCSPCRFQCSRTINRECLSAITPEEVFLKVSQYLEENNIAK